MPTVIYSMSVSLDGHMAGPDGDIGWTAPGEELMRFHNEQTREIGAHVCGRGLYEDMLPWETTEESEFDPAGREFARMWKVIPKLVFSTTLDRVEGNARLATDDVAAELARVELLPGKDIVSIGGAGLAATLIARNLVDEYRLFVDPIVLGGGSPFFPPLDRAIDLELLETRTFDGRAVYLRYRRL